MKNILFFGAGLVIGGATGLLISNLHFKKKYSEICDKQIQEMEEYYGKTDEYARQSYIDVPTEEEKIEETSGEGRENGILPAEERAAIKERAKYEKNKERVDYAGMYQPEREIVNEEEEIEESSVDPTAEERAENKRKHPEPEIIPEDALGELPVYFDNIVLHYYTEDEMLIADEDGEPVESYELLIGDALEEFAENDEPMLFVANYDHDCTYEIQKHWSAYYS